MGDEFLITCIKERLSEFASMRGVSEGEVISLRLRPLQSDGSVAYVGWPTHQEAMQIAGVQRVPASEGFFGQDWLPGGQRAYAHREILWIPHETGLEIIGLALGIIGAIEPVIKAVRWLSNKLMGKPERDIYQPHPVHTIRLEVRILREGRLEERVLLDSVESLVARDPDLLKAIKHELTNQATQHMAAPAADG